MNKQTPGMVMSDTDFDSDIFSVKGVHMKWRNRWERLFGCQTWPQIKHDEDINPVDWNVHERIPGEGKEITTAIESSA